MQGYWGLVLKANFGYTSTLELNIQHAEESLRIRNSDYYSMHNSRLQLKC